ncbi:MAG: hypothetical protein OXU20_05945 [Myxococcales bacterium]|nr:hypothetical protein [Myxococcales bacterium]
MTRSPQCMIFALLLAACDGTVAGRVDAGPGGEGRTDGGNRDGGDRDSVDGDNGDGEGWLDHPELPFPERLSELGVFPDMADPTHADPRAVSYTPAFPLWSNGSRKLRHVVLPSQVDNRTADWGFPRGSVFLKTFFFGTDLSQPIETRVMRQGEQGWDYAVYAWRGDEAMRTDGRSHRVEVEGPEGSLDHEIPGRLACRACHESSPSWILGFRELQLNHVAGGGEQTELERLGDLFTEGTPEVPDAIEQADGETRAVLGYLEGNCVACHNGTTEGPNSTYDLSHRAALDSLIDQPAMSSGTIAGTRVIPGDADNSVVILSMRGQIDADPMPPVGVQRIDDVMIDRISDWIDAL